MNRPIDHIAQHNNNNSMHLDVSHTHTYTRTCTHTHARTHTHRQTDMSLLACVTSVRALSQFTHSGEGKVRGAGEMHVKLFCYLPNNTATLSLMRGRIESSV